MVLPLRCDEVYLVYLVYLRDPGLGMCRFLSVSVALRLGVVEGG